jgi:20S proteasome alpha/beta subunit
MLLKLLKVHSIFIIKNRTVVGVKCKDGIILGAEKLVFSELLV